MPTPETDSAVIPFQATQTEVNVFRKNGIPLDAVFWENIRPAYAAGLE